MSERQEQWQAQLLRELEEQDAVEQARKRQERRRSLQSITALTLSTALLGAVFSLFAIKGDESRRERDAKEQTYVRYNQEQQLAILIKRADEAQRENTRLEALLEEALSGKPKTNGQSATPASPDKKLTDDIEKSNRDLEQRMSALETAIIQTPEKAVSLPLIRQQLVDMQDKDKGESDALHGEIGRLFGIMQWFLGLMITIIIGVASMAINSFRQGGEKGKTTVLSKPHAENDASPSSPDKAGA